MSAINISEKGKLHGLSYKVIGLSITGLSHTKKGTDNQDSFCYQKIGNSILIAVADGVGSCVNSKLGANFAIEAVKELHKCLEAGKLGLYVKKSIKKFIIKEWKGKVEGLLSEYSTTIKFAIIGDSNILLGGIGDGEIFASIDENFYSLLSSDDLFGNMTYSLTEDIEEEQFDVVRVSLPDDCKVVNVFLGTDGITIELQCGRGFDFLNYLGENVREREDNYENEIIEWVTSLQEKNGDDKTMMLLTMERRIVM